MTGWQVFWSMVVVIVGFAVLAFLFWKGGIK